MAEQRESLEVRYGESETEDSLQRGNVTRDGKGLREDSVQFMHRKRSGKQADD